MEAHAYRTGFIIGGIYNGYITRVLMVDGITFMTGCHYHHGHPGGRAIKKRSDQ